MDVLEGEMNKLSVVSNLSLGDLRKVTWDCANMDIVGYCGRTLIRKWMFEAIDFRSPVLVRRCNISEGWVEYLVVEGEDPRTIQDLGCRCEIVRDHNGSPVIKREEYHGRVSVRDPHHNVGEIAVVSS